MSSLADRVVETLRDHALLTPGDLVVVGVSGGPDSLCLLHVLRELQGDWRLALHVAHLHHGLRGREADEDARFVAQLCTSWGLPYTVEHADVPSLARQRRLAIEEAARQARYAFLAALARQLGASTVAVAHNADDQVETVLMHFLRGSGLSGLRGMRPLAWLDEMRLGDPSLELPPSRDQRLRLVRPLLSVWRREIEAYCEAHGLEPRFDLSNLDQTYYRNRLRHELIPFLETYNPAIKQIVCRTAQVVGADAELLRQQMVQAWSQVIRSASEQVIVYDLQALRSLPLSLQRSVLREGIHRLRRSLRNIDWVHVEDALRVVREGHTGAAATLPQGLLLRLGYAEATMGPSAARPGESGEGRPHLGRGPLLLPVPGEVDLGESGWHVQTRIMAREAVSSAWEGNPDPYVAYLDARRSGRSLFLRSRQQGDRFCPLGLQGRQQKLSAFMINAKIPQPERDLIPLLASGPQILWVVGWRLDARYAVDEETTEVLVVRFTRRVAPGEPTGSDARSCAAADESPIDGEFSDHG